MEGIRRSGHNVADVAVRRRAAVVTVAVSLVAAFVVALAPVTARAQEPNEVTGLSVEQRDGFATLRWTPVDGATDYQIERTPVDADNQPTGAAVIVGLWQAKRQVNQGSPAFADAGFNPGDRFQWRVRARFDTVAQPYSQPVAATTLPPWGDPGVPGENLRTQWESTLAAQFTNDVNEYAYTAALDAASDRVRVVEIGRTVRDRPINMFIIGHPAPPATAEAIAAGSTALINCNVHGNEPSSREACMILARELAFGEDPRTIDILSNTTVLMVPTINGDGRAANTRGNATGADLNRGYSLLEQPENHAFVEMLRDYRPQAGFDGHEFGNSQAADLPVLPPRHLNVAQSIFDETHNGLIEGWLYEHGSADGWWYCPYGCQNGGNVGLSQETILRNTMGLKNTIGSLLETRSAGGTTRPNEANAQNNRRRKTYSALYTYQEFLDYFRANEQAIHDAVDASVEFQISNTGPIVMRGSRPIPAHPAPHPGEAPPPLEPASAVIDDPPCGYLLTEEQYNGPRTDQTHPLLVNLQTTLAERIEAHGWTVHARPNGYLVPLNQRERGLIPLLFDALAAEPWTEGQRLFECPIAEADASVSAAAVENTQTTATLTITNASDQPDQDLNWTITEAAADCTAPSNLTWASVDQISGTTVPSSSSAVTVTFDATGLTAPDVHTGLLCVSTNDAGAPVLAVPITLQVQYPFPGFVAPVANPPALNPVVANAAVPVKFTLGGNRGLAILAAGSPESQQVDCTTREPIGAVTATRTAGASPLQYDAATDTYTYAWKTSKPWAGTCRQFLLTLDDASTHVAYFQFH